MSIFINENILNEVSTSEKRYYRLTFKNMDGETVHPSVPKNYFTKNGYEDGVTKRVCFAPDIGKCLMAMSMKCADMECFVMIPDGKYVLVMLEKMVMSSPMVMERKLSFTIGTGNG